MFLLLASNCVVLFPIQQLFEMTVSSVLPLEEYLSIVVNPVLEELVTLLIEQRPSDPVPILIKHLQSKQHQHQQHQPILTMLSQLKRNGSTGVISDGMSDGGYGILSPCASQGLISPTHSPTNIAKYLNRGARNSVLAEPTDDIFKRFALSTGTSKSEEVTRRLLSMFQSSILFADKSFEDQRMIIEALTEERVEVFGSEIVLNGCIIFVESGQLECETVFNGNVVVEQFGAGKVIGEEAGMYNYKCEVTRLITLNDDVIIWRLERDYFDYLSRNSAVKKRLRHLGFLASVPILSSMNQDELEKICDALKSEHLEVGQEIIQQGERGKKFYIVESGICTVTKSWVEGQVPQFVKEYGPGDYFGELSLIKNEPRDFSVSASTDVVVLSLDRPSFKRLLGPIEDLLLRQLE